jgi:hypothetical protein
VKAGSAVVRDESIWPMPNAMDEAARQAREAMARLSRSLGHAGEEGERLASGGKPGSVTG